MRFYHADFLITAQYKFFKRIPVRNPGAGEADRGAARQFRIRTLQLLATFEGSGDLSGKGCTL